MTSLPDQAPDTGERVAKQRRNLTLLAYGILLFGGLAFATLGLYTLVKGEIHFQHLSGRGHVKGERVATPLSFSGSQARWSGASFVAIGSSLLLSLFLVPHAIAAHFSRSGLSKMPIWQFGLLSAAALLFGGGIVGMVVGFLV